MEKKPLKRKKPSTKPTMDFVSLIFLPMARRWDSLSTGDPCSLASRAAQPTLCPRSRATGASRQAPVPATCSPPSTPGGRGTPQCCAGPHPRWRWLEESRTSGSDVVGQKQVPLGFMSLGTEETLTAPASSEMTAADVLCWAFPGVSWAFRSSCASPWRP